MQKPAATVEILLDGAAVAVLDEPPGRVEVDFGRPLPDEVAIVKPGIRFAGRD